MASHVRIDESVEGKRVLNGDGEVIGIVSGVHGSTAYVTPDPGVSDAIASKLGWKTVDGNDHPLDEESIERITDDEVHLRTYV